MVYLEDWMNIQQLHQLGLSQCQIAERLDLDRKTVRKYLHGPPQGYPTRAFRSSKLDPYHNYLRERWEQGVHNSHKLFLEIQKRGYPGGYSQVRHLLSSWRVEEQERAFVRFETAPGEQCQFDWAHFGNFLGHHLYLFALTLCYSRMRYIEFTQRQDLETLLSCMVHAFHYVGGVTEVALTDNMKTVVLENQDGQVRWNARFLDFASYYGFVPRACHPYRPVTKGKIERTIGFVRQSFWPGLDPSSLDSLAGLNQQAWAWMEDVNHRRHATTQEVPYERLAKENLRSVAHQPDYDTSYVSYRQVAKDCLFSYHGNRYSVPHAYAGKTVVVKEPVKGGQIRICHQQDQIAKHLLAVGKGEMVIDAEHYRGLPRRDRMRQAKPQLPKQELSAGPGVGRHFAVPEVQVRPLTSYEEVIHVSAV
jgi:transposase